MYYMLFYHYVDDYLERREPLREAHLARARQAYEQGELTMAGAFTEPPLGAALVFKVEDPTRIEQFVQNDPYVQNGLVTQWEIRPWTVVFK